jgi:hypothetical protein
MSAPTLKSVQAMAAKHGLSVWKLKSKATGHAVYSVEETATSRLVGTKLTLRGVVFLIDKYVTKTTSPIPKTDL